MPTFLFKQQQMNIKNQCQPKLSASTKTNQKFNPYIMEGVSRLRDAKTKHANAETLTIRYSSIYVPNPNVYPLFPSFTLVLVHSLTLTQRAHAQIE
jgi:hypothetical protein